MAMRLHTALVAPAFIACLTLMFFTSGIEKIVHFRSTVEGFAKKFSVWQSLATLVISAVIILEIVAPLFLVNYPLLGNRRAYLPLAQIATFSLIIFTLLCNFLYHWPMVGHNYYAFMSNLSTIGGLGLLLYVLTLTA